MTKTKSAKLILAISHQIFLTKEERYALVGGETINTVAYNVPVWFFQGATSEPATEVFCRYTICNKPTGADVKFATEGYKITIPHLPSDYQPLPQISNDEWRKLSMDDREKLHAQYSPPPHGKNLLDLKDGGSAYLRFQLQKKMKKDKKFIDIVHYVTVQDMNALLCSLEL